MVVIRWILLYGIFYALIRNLCPLRTEVLISSPLTGSIDRTSCVGFALQYVLLS